VRTTALQDASKSKTLRKVSNEAYLYSEEQRYSRLSGKKGRDIGNTYIDWSTAFLAQKTALTAIIGWQHHPCWHRRIIIAILAEEIAKVGNILSNYCDSPLPRSLALKQGETSAAVG
jgi:hypothetical protein